MQEVGGQKRGLRLQEELAEALILHRLPERGIENRLQSDRESLGDEQHRLNNVPCLLLVVGWKGDRLYVVLASGRGLPLPAGAPGTRTPGYTQAPAGPGYSYAPHAWTRPLFLRVAIA